MILNRNITKEGGTGDSNRYEEISVNTRVYGSWTFGTLAFLVKQKNS